MRTLYAEHLILEVTDETEFGQWKMSVCNNGVTIGSTYGPVPCPSDDALCSKAEAIAANLPRNIWS